jgi:hypothetical protein
MDSRLARLEQLVPAARSDKCDQFNHAFSAFGYSHLQNHSQAHVFDIDFSSYFSSALVRYEKSSSLRDDRVIIFYFAFSGDFLPDRRIAVKVVLGELQLGLESSAIRYVVRFKV